VLQHADPIAIQDRTPAPAAASPRAAAETAFANAPEQRAPDDRLSRVLRDAVASRAPATPEPLRTPVLQRFFLAPGNLAGQEQRAADYVWGQGGAIARAYLQGTPAKKDLHAVVRRTFIEMLPANQRGTAAMRRWSNRLAEDLSSGRVAHRPSLMQSGADLNVRDLVLTAAVRALNVLEQDTAADARLETELVMEVKVGTEFTFTNDEIRETDPGVTDKAAKAMVVRWRRLVEQDRILVPKTIKDKKGKADGSDEKNAVKFTYDLGGGKTWWWALDIDPGCLETQTAPASKLELDAVKHIIARHIFGKLTELGLVVDPSDEGGGGHISLDMATLFGKSAELLLTVLTQLQSNVANWNAHFNYVDAPNSPWLADQGFVTDTGKGGGQRAFATLVGRLQQQLAAGEIATDEVAVQLNTFHTQLVNLWATQTKATPAPKKGTGKTAGTKFASDKNVWDKAQERADNVLAHPEHYQAVNVEHIAPTVKASKRRIELRAIGAQESYENLVADLRYIYARIEQARKEVSANVSARRKLFTGS
jgi:hypothetical protein